MSRKSRSGQTGEGGADISVTTADLREKMEAIQRATVRATTQGGAPKVIGALIGAAVALTVSFLAGRSSRRSRDA